MSIYLIEQIERLDNIDVQLGTKVVEVHGNNRLESITTRDRETGVTRRESTPAPSLFIEALPHKNMLGDLVTLSTAGFVLTGPLLFINGKCPVEWTLRKDPYLIETSVPGIFVTGDVRHGVIRRVASAVGQGSTVNGFVH
jgi:thioredoxin reductase (NADPH)